MSKQALRKSSEDVRNEGTVAKAKRTAHLEKTAAFDLKYKADALARREKLAAEAAGGAPKA